MDTVHQRLDLTCLTQSYKRLVSNKCSNTEKSNKINHLSLSHWIASSTSLCYAIVPLVCFCKLFTVRFPAKVLTLVWLFSRIAFTFRMEKCCVRGPAWLPGEVRLIIDGAASTSARGSLRTVQTEQRELWALAGLQTLHEDKSRTLRNWESETSVWCIRTDPREKL